MDLNKIKTIVLTCVLYSLTSSLQAQTSTKYWVRFKDKNFSPYSVGIPSAYLSARSIARRTNQGISIDITDIPVNQSYINQVNATGAQVFQRSKWMNAAIVIITNTVQLNAVNSLTCVLNSSPVARFKKTKADELTEVVNTNTSKKTTGYDYGGSLTQNSQIGADCMHELGYRGQNMVIGVLDNGFLGVDVNTVFDSLRNEGRILGTRDIVGGNSSVYGDSNDGSHGAKVLSVIVGNTPGQLIGTGPKASVYLIHTEDNAFERPIEECNWIVGAEYADSVGVDIVTTSLGYTSFDSPYTSHIASDFNGRTSPISIASTMAARKGIFVLNAAGNDGAAGIGMPADADSICTVGAVNGSGVHASFSSVGPTADGRIKPELSAMGQGVYYCDQSGSFLPGGDGTSFATPILAGAVACLWQAHPNRNNMAILNALKATASQSANPDNSYGWGIPNMCAAHNYLNLYNGIEEKSKLNSIILFPNPAHNKISFTLNQKPQTVVLTDILGHMIDFSLTEKETNLFEMNLNNTIANGVYFISIKTSEGTLNSKFIKE